MNHISHLPLPPTLRKMIDSKIWRHPGHEVMRTKVPFIDVPLIVLKSKEAMVLESQPLMGVVEIENEQFSEYVGSKAQERALPWIDVEQTLFIMVSQWPGDDGGIALDYRSGLHVPRVVGSDWSCGDRCAYREISSSFDDFARLLGI